MLAKGEAGSETEFGTHFNPRLALHSVYFNALDKMMKCVERNVSLKVEEQETVCAKEFKALRLAAFKDELLYHNVNRRHFMHEIQFKKGESPY